MNKKVVFCLIILIISFGVISSQISHKELIYHVSFTPKVTSFMSGESHLREISNSIFRTDVSAGIINSVNDWFHIGASLSYMNYGWKDRFEDNVTVTRNYNYLGIRLHSDFLLFQDYHYTTATFLTTGITPLFLVRTTKILEMNNELEKIKANPRYNWNWENTAVSLGLKLHHSPFEYFWFTLEPHYSMNIAKHAERRLYYFGLRIGVGYATYY